MELLCVLYLVSCYSGSTSAVLLFETYTISVSIEIGTFGVTLFVCVCLGGGGGGFY